MLKKLAEIKAEMLANGFPMEAGFLEFMAASYGGTGIDDAQIDASRLAFFAGALVTYQIMLDATKPPRPDATKLVSLLSEIMKSIDFAVSRIDSAQAAPKPEGATAH